VDGQSDPRSSEKRQADALATTLILAATALDTGTPSPTRPRSIGPAPAPTGAGPSDTANAAGNARIGVDDPRAATTGAIADATGGEVRGEVRGEVVPGFGAKANLTITIDWRELQAATAEAIGQTVYCNGLSAATIRRLACDAAVIPIVLGSNSEPLDVGRRERLVTRAMRRALNTRDKGCVVCGAPPVMCDAHHLISWIDGGATKISNLVLLCRRHHTELHKGHWRITITDGVVEVARPTWADALPPPTNLPPRGSQPAANEQSEPALVLVGPVDDEARRDATCLAIWGEARPPRPPATSKRAPDSSPTDPWSDRRSEPTDTSEARSSEARLAPATASVAAQTAGGDPP
jgi:hypothetical protein